LPYPTNGGVQEVLGIEIDFLPLWLAKIPITPKMKIESNNLKEQHGTEYVTTLDKLVEYQLKAKDVLAKAFLDENFVKNYLCLDPEDRAIAYFQEIKQRKLLEQQAQELIPKARSFEQLISAGNSQTMLEVGKAFKTGRNRLFAFLRSKDILMSGKDKQNVPYQQYLEQKLFVVREYTIPDEDGELINRTQTLVTAKGIEFIDKLLKEINYDLEAFSDLD
jgi:phage antirepressor YoqD-like protein